jgi:ATP-dependent Clp protease ATP-binding subunit ClpB
MRMDKLTNQLQSALSEAQSIAIGNDHAAIEPPHLLVALLNQQGGSVRPILNRAGFDVSGLQNQLNEQLEKLAQVKFPTGEGSISQDLGRLLNLADRAAQKNNDQFISSETLLRAALEDEGPLGKTLSRFGDIKKAKEAIASVRGNGSVDHADAEEQREALNKYTIDLTERAEMGKLDPVIGRDDEIRRTIQVLQRRTKNNPVLIGEPGVGKTATYY